MTSCTRTQLQVVEITKKLVFAFLARDQMIVTKIEKTLLEKDSRTRLDFQSKQLKVQATSATIPLVEKPLIVNKAR